MTASRPEVPGILQRDDRPCSSYWQRNADRYFFICLSEPFVVSPPATTRRTTLRATVIREYRFASSSL